MIPEQDWQKSDLGQGFSVEFPGEPRLETSDLSGPWGKYKQYTYTVFPTADPSLTFEVNYFDLTAEDLTKRTVEERIENFLSRFIPFAHETHINARYYRKEVAVEGHPGKEFRVVVRNSRGNLNPKEHLLLGVGIPYAERTRLLRLTASGVEGNVSEPVVRRFFDSLNLPK